MLSLQKQRINHVQQTLSLQKQINISAMPTKKKQTIDITYQVHKNTQYYQYHVPMKEKQHYFLIKSNKTTKITKAPSKRKYKN
jgi:hypothetical protein